MTETQPMERQTIADRLRDDIDAAHTWAQSLVHDALDVDALPLEDALAQLDTLRWAIFGLRDAEAAYERHIAQLFAKQKLGKQHQVDGTGLVEVDRPQSRREWRHDDLAKEWLERWQTTHMADGVIPPPAEVVSAFRQAASVGSWKVTGCRELGIEVDEFCTKRPGAPKVKLPGDAKRKEARQAAATPTTEGGPQS